MKYKIPSEKDPRRKWPCTECGTEAYPRDQMVAKRVIFTTMGAGYSTLRSRTTHYLCPVCRDVDPEWTSPTFAGPRPK